MTITVKAVYENGVFKPLEAVDIQEHEILDLSFSPLPKKKRKIVKLGGALKPYLTGPMPSYEALEAFIQEEHQRSLDRLLRQMDGDFEERDDDDAG